MKTSNKTLYPSLKSIGRILSQAKFDPRIPGPLSTVVKIADANYLELKAIEFIQEARSERMAVQDFISREEYTKLLRRAIQCLALAIHETL
jgi:hypothetical protein